MNYIEALQALVEGKKIREKNWNKNRYLFLSQNGDICNAYGVTITVSINEKEDILGNDWEIYQTEEERLTADGKRWKIYMCCDNCKSCLHCEGKQEELYRLCSKDNRVSALNVIKNLSDDEVDKLYNAIKGEIDA